MTQLELFPLDILQQSARATTTSAKFALLCDVHEAYTQYASECGLMYADEIQLRGETLTVIPSFWPDMASQYMEEAHPDIVCRWSNTNL